MVFLRHYGLECSEKAGLCRHRIEFGYFKIPIYQADCGIDCLLDGMIDCLLDGMIECLLDGMTDCLLDGMTDCLLDGVIDCLIEYHPWSKLSYAFFLIAATNYSIVNHFELENYGQWTLVSENSLNYLLYLHFNIFLVIG